MPVGAQDPVHLAHELWQAGVGDRAEPVGGEPGGGAARAVDLQRFVRRIGDHQVHRLRREAAQQVECVGNHHAPAVGGRRRGEGKLEQVGFAHARNLPEPSDIPFSMA